VVRSADVLISSVITPLERQYGSAARLSGTGTFQYSSRQVDGWCARSLVWNNAVAGYFVGIRVILFALLPSWACQTPPRWWARLGEETERLNVPSESRFTLVFLFSRPDFHFVRGRLSTLSHTIQTLPYGVTVWHRRLTVFLLRLRMVLTQSFNGAGDT